MAKDENNLCKCALRNGANRYSRKNLVLIKTQDDSKG